MSIADANGVVFGGHLARGSIVCTTAEVLIALLPGWTFSRELDAQTGYRERVVRRALDSDRAQSPAGATASQV